MLRLLRAQYLIAFSAILRLTREMEYHADALSAMVCKSDVLKHFLHRHSLIQESYDSTVNYCVELIGQNSRTKNLYRDHLFAMRIMAEECNIGLKNGLPLVTSDNFNFSRLVLKSKWDSHPPIKERIARLEKFGYDALSASGPATALFQHINRYQEAFTDMLYTSLHDGGGLRILQPDVSQVTFEHFLRPVVYPGIF